MGLQPGNGRWWARVPWCPCPPPTARSQGASTGDGTRGCPPAVPGDSQGRGPGRQTRAGPRRLLPLALPVPEGARAAAPGRGWGGQAQLPPAAAPWGGGAGTRDGVGMAPHPVYKRWREEARPQGHGRQRLPWDPALLSAGTNVPRSQGDCQATPAPRAVRPQKRGTQGPGEPLTLQAPSRGSVHPQTEASRRDPSVGTRVLPYAVSPLAGGAGGKARCAELAGWKQGHGAAAAERPHARPRSRCPRGHSTGTTGPR